MKLILDVDTGTDDAIAIMLACLRPELDLLACTTVFGNTGVADCTANTLSVLDLLGWTDIPVHEGAVVPLHPYDERPADPRSYAIHGNELPLPASSRRPSDVAAVDFLANAYAAPSDVTLVAVAPLTNLASALRRDPRIAGNIPRLVVMGGGHAICNTTASAEHNIWADPEAAAEVLGSGIGRIDLVPLDATHDALFSRADCARLERIGTVPARAAATLIDRRIAGYDETQPMEARETAPVHDALCVALLVDPTLVEARHVHVDVETEGRLTRGRTVIDVHHRGGGPPNCHVALAADGPRFVDFVIGTFADAVGSPSIPTGKERD